MIDHLIQRQDVKDRKKLLMLGSNPAEKPRSPSNGALPRSTLNSQRGKKLHPGAPEVTFSTRPAGKRGLSPTKNTPEQNRISPHGSNHGSPRESPVCPDTVLKVDKNCLNCSGNMTHTVKAIKTACLMYTQGSIPYRNRDYHIDDVLSIKASVVAQC